MNLQIIMKQDLPNDSGIIDVVRIFKTIQGEGPFAGHRTIFIRLMGCNLQCPMCDTDYSSHWTRMTPAEIIAEIEKISFAPYLIVISGGEPFRQNIEPLVQALIGNGYEVQIETNGTLFINIWEHLTSEEQDMITVVCSPKSGRLNTDLIPYIDAFKYVLDHRSVDPEDGLPILALDHTAHPRVARPPSFYEGWIYVNPADPGEPWNKLGAYDLNVQAAIKSCQKFGYILGLQIHKIIGME